MVVTNYAMCQRIEAKEGRSSDAGAAQTDLGRDDVGRRPVEACRDELNFEALESPRFPKRIDFAKHKKVVMEGEGEERSKEGG